MVLTDKARMAVKWTALAIEAAFFIVFILLCVAIAAKNNTIKRYKQTLTEQTATIDSLQGLCKVYGAMGAIEVNTTFVINNKNIMSVNTTAVNNISRTYAIMTKEEILHAMDSVGYWKNNDKQ